MLLNKVTEKSDMQQVAILEKSKVDVGKIVDTDGRSVFISFPQSCFLLQVGFVDDEKE